MEATMPVDTSDRQLSRKVAIISILWIGVFTALAFGLILYGDVLLGIFG